MHGIEYNLALRENINLSIKASSENISSD